MLQDEIDKIYNGWQLVPKEMIDEMRSKYWDVDEKFQEGLATHLQRVLIVNG